MRPPSYILGWIGLIAVVFAGSFFAVRTVRTGEAEPTPALVRNAVVVDDVHFVTADQVLEANRAAEPAKPVIVDVRTTGEFASAHIAGAMNIQDFQLPDALPNLPRDRAWVLYCTCPDDRLAKWGAAAIEAAGFPNGLVLQQGLSAWQQAGGPMTLSNDPNAVQTGCGCSIEAPAVKLWAIAKAEEREQAQIVQAPTQP
jgi:rhodanese-related sulfurtransferase